MKVRVNNSYQKNYEYTLSEKEGKNFDKEFKPELTPKEMLSLGVFGGKYFDGEHDEYPKDWFEDAKLSISGEYEKDKNFFKVKASSSLQMWREKGWISDVDPRGWFEWYCRYYMGRRIVDEDQRQIKRWKKIRRHIVQVTRNCDPEDICCRPKQRQAILHWAYDSRKL